MTAATPFSNWMGRGEGGEGREEGRGGEGEGSRREEGGEGGGRGRGGLDFNLHTHVAQQVDNVCSSRKEMLKESNE